jgi:exosortase/archaeosortase family protein
MTKIDFMIAPSGEAAILIDARCSGIHSLTIFTAIFLIMLFEARRRLRWNYRTGLVTLIGIFGTYLINILRIVIVISLYYFYGREIGEPVHNYLGYIMLILWIPVFWLFILPLSEKKEIREQRKQKRIERKKKKKKKNHEAIIENLEEKISESDIDDSSSSL